MTTPIRLDALAVPVTPYAARILLRHAPWARMHELLIKNGAPPAAIQEIRRTWDGLQSIMTLADQYGTAPVADDPRENLDAAGDDIPMTAVEAAEILGVGDKRVKQLAAQGQLTRVTVPGDRRVHVDPASVRDYATRRAAARVA